ncbi:VATF ATPase, partial [Upupa epops]|nr:VATF ATPase [Upupa epops]
MSGRGKLIAVVGDEDTVTGFLLGGVGELDKHRKPNFLVVEKETSLAEIEETFRAPWPLPGRQGHSWVSQVPPTFTRCFPSLSRSFLNREDIGIILISQCLAELIRHAVEAHHRPIPAILEIPSKEHPYDPTKDSVLRRARGLFTPDDLR